MGAEVADSVSEMDRLLALQYRILSEEYLQAESTTSKPRSSPRPRTGDQGLAPYFIGEKAVGSITTLLMRSTSGPSFSLAANTACRSGSARNSWKRRVRSS